MYYRPKGHEDLIILEADQKAAQRFKATAHKYDLFYFFNALFISFEFFCVLH